jgi:DeoR/GlpR family transcriptional regulator of sugar metabolism
MVDHSKFEQDALFAYAGLDAVDLMITGTETPDDVVARYQQLGHELVRA